MVSRVGSTRRKNFFGIHTFTSLLVKLDYFQAQHRTNSIITINNEFQEYSLASTPCNHGFACDGVLAQNLNALTKAYR